MWFKHAQNAKQPIAAARPERAEALSPGQRPGLWASALSGRAAVGFLAFWACCCELLGLRPYLKPANFKRIIQKKERK